MNIVAFSRNFSKFFQFFIFTLFSYRAYVNKNINLNTFYMYIYHRFLQFLLLFISFFKVTSHNGRVWLNQKYCYFQSSILFYCLCFSYVFKFAYLLNNISLKCHIHGDTYVPLFVCLHQFDICKHMYLYIHMSILTFLIGK